MAEGMTPQTDPMRIEVNGQHVETDAGVLSELVVRHSGTAVRVATAVNGRFVPAAARASTRLAPGDKVEIVSPRQGG